MEATQSSVVPTEYVRPMSRESNHPQTVQRADQLCYRVVMCVAVLHQVPVRLTDALGAICRRFHVQRLDLFGSAATGDGFDPARSDLDFLVTFGPLPPPDYTDAYFGLREALETLSGLPVDLLTDVALANPYLRRRVEAERLPLFQSR